LGMRIASGMEAGASIADKAANSAAMNTNQHGFGFSRRNLSSNGCGARQHNCDRMRRHVVNKQRYYCFALRNRVLTPQRQAVAPNLGLHRG
jgi:hypothetical protein